MIPSRIPALDPGRSVPTAIVFIVDPMADVVTSVALLKGLQERSGTACLFISHDLGVIGQVAGRVVVLRDGIVREAGRTQSVFRQPADDYTRLLVEAARRGYARLPGSPAAMAAVS